eukprot:TRINITY_DN24656_c0_g1_i2.p1 TRINITY_DN24656_c0_g1~~TRINITY_DN24656_c0_g1_i2.p1  ORF type:complete len:732 (-),score=192.37 TRINITY_DN24656_c0_g1_i2:36-2075(-)
MAPPTIVISDGEDGELSISPAEESQERRPEETGKEEEQEVEASEADDQEWGQDAGPGSRKAFDMMRKVRVKHSTWEASLVLTQTNFKAKTLEAALTDSFRKRFIAKLKSLQPKEKSYLTYNLDISEMEMSTDVCAVLVKFVKKLHRSKPPVCIRSLRAYRNRLGDEGARLVAELILSQPLAISQIHLSHNGLTGLGAACVSMAAGAAFRRYPFRMNYRSERWQGCWMRLEMNQVTAPYALVDAMQGTELGDGPFRLSCSSLHQREWSYARNAPWSTTEEGTPQVVLYLFGQQACKAAAGEKDGSNEENPERDPSKKEKAQEEVEQEEGDEDEEEGEEEEEEEAIPSSSTGSKIWVRVSEDQSDASKSNGKGRGVKDKKSEWSQAGGNQSWNEEDGWNDWEWSEWGNEDWQDWDGWSQWVEEKKSSRVTPIGANTKGLAPGKGAKLMPSSIGAPNPAKPSLFKQAHLHEEPWPKAKAKVKAKAKPKVKPKAKPDEPKEDSRDPDTNQEDKTQVAEAKAKQKWRPLKPPSDVEADAEHECRDTAESSKKDEKEEYDQAASKKDEERPEPPKARKSLWVPQLLPRKEPLRAPTRPEPKTAATRQYQKKGRQSKEEAAPPERARAPSPNTVPDASNLFGQKAELNDEARSSQEAAKAVKKGANKMPSSPAAIQPEDRAAFLFQ